MITALIIIGSIVVLLLIAAGIMKKETFIEREIIINRPKQVVFDYIKYVKNHDNFNVWMQMDPEMKKEFRGTDGTVGFVYFWESNKEKNVGTGEQEIKNIANGEFIEFELRFIKPMQSIAFAKITTQAISENQTKVIWSFKGEIKFPMNVMSIIMEKMLAGHLQKGLENLKAILEK